MLIADYYWSTNTYNIEIYNLQYNKRPLINAFLKVTPAYIIMLSLSYKRSKIRYGKCTLY